MNTRLNKIEQLLPKERSGNEGFNNLAGAMRRMLQNLENIKAVSPEYVPKYDCQICEDKIWVQAADGRGVKKCVCQKKTAEPVDRSVSSVTGSPRLFNTGGRK